MKNIKKRGIDTWDMMKMPKYKKLESQKDRREKMGKK